jgi:hypothetical protein
MNFGWVPWIALIGGSVFVLLQYQLRSAPAVVNGAFALCAVLVLSPVIWCYWVLVSFPAAAILLFSLLQRWREGGLRQPELTVCVSLLGAVSVLVVTGRILIGLDGGPGLAAALLAGMLFYAHRAGWFVERLQDGRKREILLV